MANVANQQALRENVRKGGEQYPVVLNPLDASLDMDIPPRGLGLMACTLSQDACGYMWAGVRSNLGVFDKSEQRCMRAHGLLIATWRRTWATHEVDPLVCSEHPAAYIHTTMHA